MENYGLDLHGEMLLEEYRQQLPLYKRLMEVMKSKTAEMIKEGELTVASMEFRIKEEAEILELSQNTVMKYRSNLLKKVGKDPVARVLK